jgi:hypothetical protein
VLTDLDHRYYSIMKTTAHIRRTHRKGFIPSKSNNSINCLPEGDINPLKSILNLQLEKQVEVVTLKL